MPGATIIGHDKSIVNIGMRRNALHPKGTSFGARLLTPYNKPRYALRELGRFICEIRRDWPFYQTPFTFTFEAVESPVRRA